MSEIENKVLGKKEEVTAKSAVKPDYFAENYIWEVSKNGCGKSLFNGRMVYEMMDVSAKVKVKKGYKDITSGDFSFKLKNKA